MFASGSNLELLFVALRSNTIEQKLSAEANSCPASQLFTSLYMKLFSSPYSQQSRTGPSTEPDLSIQYSHVLFL